MGNRFIRAGRRAFSGLVRGVRNAGGRFAWRNGALPQADDIQTIAERLEVINLQLARQKETRRKALHLFFVLFGVGTALLFALLVLWKSPYLNWDYADPETDGKRIRRAVKILRKTAKIFIANKEENTMKYSQKITLKNGKEVLLRNGTAADGAAVLENFNLTHAETDFLLSHPGEKGFTTEQEANFLDEKEKSANEVEIVAFVDGKVTGTAGIDAVGSRYKVKHRAEFGISIAKEYWGLGLGKALTEACIACAKEAGYTQLELDVVAENESALALYRKVGFVEYGRNPRGFNSRIGGYQELVYMRLEL